MTEMRQDTPEELDTLQMKLEDVFRNPKNGFGIILAQTVEQAFRAIAALREQLEERRLYVYPAQIAKLIQRAERAEADNAALRHELDELAGQLALTVKELFETEDRTEAAEADNAALRKDALRYRWLRDTGDATWQPMANREISAKQCDADIDAALAAKEK